MKKLFWLPLAAAALTSVTAAAQRSLVPGEITRGSLSNADPALDNGAYYDEYVFDARRGETVVLLMNSTSFDAYLRLGTARRSGGWRELAYDDDGGDGGDGRNARLQYQVPEDGTYTVRASSLGRGATGQYMLTLSGGRVSGGGGYYDDRVEPRPRPRPRNDRRDGLVQAGDLIEGYLSPTDPKLDGGEPFHLYQYNGRAGERLSLTLRSGDFDSYLVLGTSGGRHGVGSVLTRDDDGGGGRDSRIEFTLPEDRVYVIRVNAFGSGSGEYVLDVESSLGGGRPDRPGRDDYDDDPFEDDGGFGDLDDRLVGRWGLVDAATRIDATRWRIVSANARFGFLDVAADGSYSWNRNGRLRTGELEAYVPTGGEVLDSPAYRLTDGREEFYVYFREFRGERYLQVNSAMTNRLVARGYLDPTSR
ncbi:MAG TPA: hypothetical protein VE871_19945 [Longimicrobium sp.]|nr:hypothetical protein [Longimicrobium sp.]